MNPNKMQQREPNGGMPMAQACPIFTAASLMKPSTIIGNDTVKALPCIGAQCALFHAMQLPDGSIVGQCSFKQAPTALLTLAEMLGLFAKAQGFDLNKIANGEGPSKAKVQ